MLNAFEERNSCENMSHVMGWWSYTVSSVFTVKKIPGRISAQLPGYFPGMLSGTNAGRLRGTLMTPGYRRPLYNNLKIQPNLVEASGITLPLDLFCHRLEKKRMFLLSKNLLVFHFRQFSLSKLYRLNGSMASLCA